MSSWYISDHIPLGYYAIGANFTLVAITPPLGPNMQPVVHDIVYANLRYRRNRIKNICRLINIAGLLHHLADLVRPIDSEFEVSERFSPLIVGVSNSDSCFVTDSIVLWKLRVIALSKLISVRARPNA